MDLLNEIQHETAREFVFDVRRQTAPLGSTDIDALDAHLRRTLASDVPLGFPASVQRGDVFEIAGPPSSGKTHLLYWLVMQCILPRDVVLSSAGAPLRSENTSTGWGKVAVVCDCDGRWNARRLHALLVARLRRLAPNHTNTTLDDIARAALKRLVVFHLGDTLSSAQLAATLTTLPDYLRTQRPSEELGLLAIDTISATYVQDRWRSELDPHTSSSLTLALHALKRIHAPLTVLANTTIATNPSPPQGVYAPPPNRVLVDSPLLVTHQISLALGVIPKFPAEMTAAEALRDTLRREIVERGIVIAKVRTLREPDVEGQFKFEIHADEIVVELFA
ncbi:hypothetical protein EXIGLDRAFT_767727 [Exidia glandulosa HHB12029]|uniref:DNA recombination and repair protein Rad51-like C-terminal domain-containing protein n=1 Tax=Exidia glandulosa HHB12029 TaxID=1314781 RepID=A0A165IQP2_EXIGL|nr:hypothetical protein EXIGLDRAFT_777857 [Exidia glandulosa HHB12029]KZV93738.1 hypothetical protein EXIGLDRAFT_767727 [Exidia glandulosa HHB12029]